MSEPIVNFKDYIDVISVRLVRDNVLSKPGVMITSPTDAIRLVGDWISTWDRECVIALYLKSNSEIAGVHIASIGSICESIVPPAEIIKCGLLCNAANFILLHNHPSGGIRPSSEDVAVTDRMLKVGSLMGMPMLDHIIVGSGNDKYFSFMEKTEMSFTPDPVPRDYQEIDWNRQPKVAEETTQENTEAKPVRRHR